MLDPYLPLPPSAVSPQSFYPLGAPPRNMMLECKNGNITADVWIVGGDHLDRIGADASKRRIASMDVKGENGFVTVRVVSVRLRSYVLKKTFCSLLLLFI